MSPDLPQTPFILPKEKQKRKGEVITYKMAIHSYTRIIMLLFGGWSVQFVRVL